MAQVANGNLELRNIQIDKNALSILCQTLAKAKITGLDLSATGLNYKGVIAVLGSISDTNILMLNLSNCLISDKGMDEIIEHLKLTNVTGVSFRYGNISEEYAGVVKMS